MSISIQNITKLYDTQKALDQVSFEVNKGEILGFLGPNGAGKSTLMKIITCFIQPTSGWLSCRQTGTGRMAEPETITAAIETAFGTS